MGLLARAEAYLQEREVQIEERRRLLAWQAELLISGEWEKRLKRGMRESRPSVGKLATWSRAPASWKGSGRIPESQPGAFVKGS